MIGLCQNHGGRRIQKTQHAQRPIPGQHQPGCQPHHHRRQSHAEIDQADQKPPALKPGQGQGRADGNTDQYADEGGNRGNMNRPPGNGQNIRVQGNQQMERGLKSVKKNGHFTASGKNRDAPYLSFPNSPIIFWVSGAIMNSTNALAPAALTLENFSGFTCIT